MEGRKKETNVMITVVLMILLFLSFVASLTKIFTGFDIDEAYALALPFRGMQGDRLFAEMWEVHQTSYFIPYLFMKLYAAINGDMNGVVIYMRTVASIIHFALAIFVFLFCKRLFVQTKEKWDVAFDFSKREIVFLSALSSLIYYNFLPKWMMNLDFSMLQLWFLTLFLIFVLKAMDSKGLKEILYWLLAGISLAMDVLAYPGMILIYPVIIVLLIRKEADKKIAWKQVGILTAGCALIAIFLFVSIMRYMTITEFIATIPKIFMDGAHQYDFMTKVSLYASQWFEVLLQTLILAIPAFILACILYKLYFKLELDKKYGPLRFMPFFCVLFEIEVSFLITFAGLVITWGPFRLQVRYIIQFVMAGLLLYSLKEFKFHKLSIIWFISLAAFVGILIASNVGPTSSASYLVIANIVFVVLTVIGAKGQGKGATGFAYAGAVLFLLSLIMCKGFYMRNTEYVPGDIFDSLVCMTEGPLKGIYVHEDDQKRFTSDYHTIKDKTNDSDKVLFMGTESLCNLYANGTVVSPTTISTPAFNEQWVEYFEMQPDKMPTIIFLAKNTVDNREKFFAKNPFGIWIAENYGVECMEETDSLCIIREK